MYIICESKQTGEMLHYSVMFQSNKQLKVALPAEAQVKLHDLKHEVCIGVKGKEFQDEKLESQEVVVAIPGTTHHADSKG